VTEEDPIVILVPTQSYASEYANPFHGVVFFALNIEDLVWEMFLKMSLIVNLQFILVWNFLNV
jgi:hypothetical protein